MANNYLATKQSRQLSLSLNAARARIVELETLLLADPDAKAFADALGRVRALESDLGEADRQIADLFRVLQAAHVALVGGGTAAALALVAGALPEKETTATEPPGAVAAASLSPVEKAQAEFDAALVALNQAAAAGDEAEHRALFDRAQTAKRALAEAKVALQ